MDGTTFLDALGGSPFLRGLSPRARRRLALLAQTRTSVSGDVILREGTDTEGLGVVLDGRLALRLHVPERGALTILTVEVGDIFGWSALVAPYRSTSTVVAVEPTTTLVFPAPSLREALEADEELAASLYPRVLRSVARRLEATRLQLLDVFGRDLDGAW